MAFVVYPTAKIITDVNEHICCSIMECMQRDPEKNGCQGHYFEHGVNGDIGDFTFIRAKKLTLGEGVHIAPRVTIVGTGSVEIGDYSTIAPGVVIYTSVPDLRFGTNKYAEKFKLEEGTVKIGKNVFVGAQAVIAQGVTIGDNAVIGAGVYVNDDVEGDSILVLHYRMIDGDTAKVRFNKRKREMEWQP